MAGWIVRRPDDEETKKKTPELPVADARLTKYAQTPQAVLPAGSLKPKSSVDEAKKLLERQGSINTPKVGILPRYTGKAQAPTLSTMPKVDALAAAKQIQQRAQGKTPQQLREQNIANIKEGLSGADARIAFEQATSPKPKQTTEAEPKEGILGPNLWAGWTRWNQNWASSVDNMLPDNLTPKPVQGVLDYYQRVGQEAGERAAKINEEQKVPELGATLMQGTATAIPDLILAWVSGGLSLTGTGVTTLTNAAANPTVLNTVKKVVQNLAKNPNYWRSVMQMFGPSVDAAKENGASDLEAVAFGMLYTMPAAGLEAATGLENMVQNPKGVLNWLKGMNEEGLEEVLQGVTERLAAKSTYAPETKWASLTDQNAVINPGRAVQEYGGGAGVAGILGAPVNIAGLAAEIRTDRQAGKNTELTSIAGENAKAAALAGALTEGADPEFVVSAREKTQQQTAPKMPPQEAAPQAQEVATPVQETTTQPETAPKAQTQTAQSGDRQSWLTWDWADRLKRKWGLGLETEKLRTELDEIYRDVDRNGWTEENTERLNKLARRLVDSEKGTVNQDRTQQIKDAKAYLRKITLPVTPDMKAELESRFGDWKTFTSKFRNRIHFRLVDGKTKLQGIDTHYSQLHELCPEWFPEGIENASDYDIMAHVVNFVENANEVRDYALNQDYDAAVAEIAEQLHGGYDEIHQLLDASGEVDATTYAPEMEDRNASAANAPAETANMLRDDTGDGGMLASARGNLEDVAEQIDGGGSYMNLDISRVLDKVAGKNKRLRQRLYEAIEKPLAEAKAKYARSVIGRLRSYKAAMDRLGIKAGSRESAAVQWYGEGQRQTGVDGETKPYTLEMLKRDFPDTWQNIVEAEKIHRLMYNEYVERINQALAMIFPNVEARAAEDLQILKEKAAVALERAREQQALVNGLVQQAEALKAQMQSGNLVEASKARQELTRLTRKIAEETHRITSRNKAANDAMQAYTDMEARIKDGSFFVGKRLMPRKDYFHHFVEMEQGIGGLVNILNRPSDIATELVGVSDSTKPKTKWWGALQRRTGAAYTEDAVGGMAKYIPAAEYKINIDPFIAQMRGTIKSLVDGSAAYKNANGFIEFLTHWTNDLAGKSNPLDRGVQTAVGRKTMRVLEWVNNRVKANAIVGNLGSAIVQIGNIPNATTYITNVKAWARAAATMMNREKANTLLAQSGFLTERYMGKVTGMFDQKGALQKGAEWLLEIGDQKASELIWLAAYNQYEEAGGNVGGKRRYESAADYADDITRRSVAGRGIGELPLTQRSRVVKLFAPFQVEVNNTFNLMKEQLGEKNAKGLISYCVSAWLTNALIEAVANKRPLLDPIQALIDAIKAAIGDEEEEGSGGAAVQRLLGEAAANVPYISTVAPMFFDTDDMERVFGEQDPTRYGTGISATADILKQIGNAIEGKPVDWVGLGTTYVTPYGGQQLERVIEASQDAGILPRRMIVDEEGNTKLKRAGTPANYNDAGKLRFGLNGAGDIALDYLFGPYATSAGREYVKGGGKPLSEKKTLTANQAVKKGIPLKTYQEYLASVDRNKNGSVTQAEAEKTLNLMELTEEQKRFLFGKTNETWKKNPF